MMNFQKYSIELADIMADHEMVGIFKETGKLKPCDEMSCWECDFMNRSYPEADGCCSELVYWMFRECKNEVS